MSEKPIIFSGPMVRAILDGTKTQDRRVLKRLPDGMWPVRDERGQVIGAALTPMPVKSAPLYRPGDRLWVRETFCYSASGGYDAKPGFDMETGANSIWYRATDDGECEGPWRPSIHMPRWASRISLLVTAVRVERLQEISEADAIAEGCSEELLGDQGRASSLTAAGAFRDLWDNINAKRPGCSWADNPWVAAISFEVRR